MQLFDPRKSGWMAALLLFCAVAGAQAQGYPARPIRVIIPFAAGGGSDVVARTAVQGIEESLGQPVQLENLPGAGGSAGSRVAARAAPDGYTLLLGSSTTMAVSPSLIARLGYDPARDFAPVGLITMLPSLLAVHPSVSAESPADLLALLRARPGALSYGSAGLGSHSHLTTELFKAAAGVDVVHVPYKGTSPALADLLSGRISMMFLSMPAALASLRAGELKILGVTTRERIADLPVPAIAEAGLPNFHDAFWYGLFAPAGTPPEIIARLNGQLNGTLALPEVRKALLDQGGEPTPVSPQEFADLLAADRLKWERLVKAIGLQVR